MRGGITLTGCPKLDLVDYSKKLTEITRNNDIRSVTVLRMKVPYCSGLEVALKKALQNGGKSVPLQAMVISIDGRVIRTL